jgi:hypothetical protein
MGAGHLRPASMSNHWEGKRMRLTKTIISRIWWLGRGTATVMGLAMLLALTVGLASTALAGTGVGARLDLGKINTVDAISSLVGSVAGPSLRVDNNSTASGATALDLRVEPNKDPLKVNSSAKVENLNVDKLDGKDSADFLAADGRAVDAARAGFADVAGMAQNAQVANDADRLDGLDSTQIGINGYEFVRTTSVSDSATRKVSVAHCPAGTQIIGGGGTVFPTIPTVSTPR